ncbi:MAG: beta-galactosidase [bacterium]
MKKYTWFILFIIVLFYGCSRTIVEQQINQPETVSQMLGIATFLSTCSDPSNVTAYTACNYQLAMCEEAGITSIRMDFTWSQIEPQNGVFDFTGYDNIVNTVSNYNININAILDYGNTWADAKNSNSYPPDNPQTFADFAYNVALHFKHRVKSYEIWNEENTPLFWQPKADPEAYGALLKAAYTAIKSADPSALVVFGGVYMWNWGGLTTGGATFLDQVLTLYPDIGNYMDIIAFHPYANYPPSTAPDFSSTAQQSLLQMIQDIKDVLKKHNISKPLWITEIGWPTYEPVDESMQARWLARTYLESIDQGINRIYWYTYSDGIGCGVPVQECYFGLFNYITSASYATPPKPKQAFYALKTIKALLGDTYFKRDLSNAFNIQDGKALYFVTPDGSKAVWAFFLYHGAIPEIISIPTSNLTFYDISGTTFTPSSYNSGYTLTITTSPVYAVMY